MRPHRTFRSARREAGSAANRPPFASALGTAALLLFSLAAAPLPLRAADSTPPAPAANTPATPPTDTSADASSAPPPADGISLQLCYQEAIANDPAIRIARANFEQALGQKILLQAVALPNINGGVDGGDQGPRDNTLNPHKHLFVLVTGSFSQPLFNVAIPSSFRLGRIEVATAEQQFNQTVTAELYALRISFYNALASRENVEVQASLQKSLQANLQSQQNQFSVGKVSHGSVNQAYVQLLAIAPGLASARGAYRQARIELAQRLGRDLGSSAAANGDPDANLPDPVGTLDGDPITLDIEKEAAYALAHRADLAALRLMIAGAQQEKNLALAPQYPTIALVANLQFIPQDAVHKSGTVTQSGSSITEATQILYGIAGSWQVTDGGLAQANASQVQAQKDSYQIDLKQLEDTVPLQLRQIDGLLKEAAAQLESSQQNVDLAQENFQQVATQVAQGDLPQLDFLHAQSNLLQARFNRINALLENNTAIAQLDFVTGRYLELLTTDAAGQPRK